MKQDLFLVSQARNIARKETILKKKMLSIIYWTKKQLKKRRKIGRKILHMQKNEQKQVLKKYYKKIKGLERWTSARKAKRHKKVVNYYKKKKGKNMSKLQIKKILRTI